VSIAAAAVATAVVVVVAAVAVVVVVELDCCFAADSDFEREFGLRRHCRGHRATPSIPRGGEQLCLLSVAAAAVATAVVVVVAAVAVVVVVEQIVSRNCLPNCCGLLFRRQ
jgi:hypothetical protein